MEMGNSDTSVSDTCVSRNPTEPHQTYLGRSRYSSLSMEGFCLSEAGLRRLDPSTFRKLWLIADWGVEQRTFAAFGERGEYLADIITGTLYNDDGSHASGGRLRLSSTPPARSRRIPAAVAGGV